MSSVIFVVGYGRSGSTLLDRLLGCAEGTVSTGELRNLWRRGFQKNQRCSCGSAFADCPFWCAVIAEAFPDGVPDPGAVLAVRRRANAVRRVRQIVRGAALSAPEREYLDLWRRIYRAIGQVSGADVIIDSSKDAGHAFFFAGAQGVDARYIHLIRDGRAAAFSRTRVKLRPEVQGGGARMRVRNPLRSALRWGAVNAEIDRLGRGSAPITRLRYEDLLRDPLATLRTTVAALGLDLDYPDTLLRDGEVSLAPNHMVSGNPVRFQTGGVALREDQEWRQAMPRRHRLGVEFIARAGLRRYGYL
ncbi:MAG: sulfotransferase [Pseudomonadota bacterium]|nr:sulfotransferase [Pseudomonadota bacterium]